MKYLKTYENIDEIEIGDYVIAIPTNIIDGSEDFFYFTIGKIVKREREYLSREKRYAVEYENIPSFIQDYYCAWRRMGDKQYLEDIIWFNQNMIKHHSKSKDDLELIIQANKYGL